MSCNPSAWIRGPNVGVEGRLFPVESIDWFATKLKSPQMINLPDLSLFTLEHSLRRNLS